MANMLYFPNKIINNKTKYLLSCSSRPPSLPPKPKKRRIGRSQMVGQPKLFGGSLEEYIEVKLSDVSIY